MANPRFRNARSTHHATARLNTEPKFWRSSGREREGYDTKMGTRMGWTRACLFLARGDLPVPLRFSNQNVTTSNSDTERQAIQHRMLRLSAHQTPILGHRRYPPASLAI